MVEPKPGAGAEGGMTLLELMVVLALLAAMACMGVGAFQRIREQGASEALLATFESLLAEARTRAVFEGTHVAIRFVARDGSVLARLYRDGDGDGVTALDVRLGTDGPLGPEQLLRADQTRVAVPTGAHQDPAGAPLDPLDPVRFGRGDCLSFSPTATATPGSLYLAEGDGSTGWAVRVTGLDGRVHLWRFKRGAWSPVESM